MMDCSKNMCSCMLLIGRRLSRLVVLSDGGFGPSKSIATDMYRVMNSDQKYHLLVYFNIVFSL